jgi:hypothetical protein
MTVPFREEVEEGDHVELECEFIAESANLQQDFRMVLRRGDDLTPLDDFDHVQVDPSPTERLEALIKSGNL